MSTTPTDSPYGFLDDIFKVKLDDKQRSYMWAKLSPQSKQALQTKIEAMVAQGRQNLAGEIYSASVEGEDWKKIVLAELNSERSK